MTLNITYILSSYLGIFTFNSLLSVATVINLSNVLKVGKREKGLVIIRYKKPLEGLCWVRNSQSEAWLVCLLLQTKKVLQLKSDAGYVFQLSGITFLHKLRL